MQINQLIFFNQGIIFSYYLALSYRYKKELTMALERESSLERSRAQLEVDWQRRCEDTEREVYHKQEQLISGLTKQRDEVCIFV